MNFLKISLCTAAIAIGAGMSAASAADSEVASLTDCLHMADQVRSALDGNQQSANYSDARKEDRYGREFCTNGFYAKGIAHYGHALQLLGVPEQGVAQKS